MTKADAVTMTTDSQAPEPNIVITIHTYEDIIVKSNRDTATAKTPIHIHSNHAGNSTSGGSNANTTSAYNCAVMAVEWRRFHGWLGSQHGCPWTLDL